MSAKYRYSNAKFWLLLSACLCLLTVSGVYHAYSLRNYARQVQADFRLSLSLLLKTTHSAVISQQRDALRGLADATVGKLQYLHITEHSADRWLSDAFYTFLAHRPMIRALAVYSIGGDQLLHVGSDSGDCLAETFAFDGFCQTTHQMAIRLSVPIYTLSSTRAGYLSAAVMIAPRDIQQAERDFGLRLQITAHPMIYSSLPMPEMPDNIQIHAPAMTQHVIQYSPTRLWRPDGLWLVLTIRLGRDPSAVVVQVARHSNFLVWKIAEAAVMNAVLLFATTIFFLYFHVNYKRISHVYRNVIDGMNDFLALINPRGEYQVINRTMAQTLFGIHPREAIGKTDQQLALPDDLRDQCAASNAAVIATHEPIRLIERGKTATGDWMVLDVLKTPLFHESGRFGGVVICGRDVTEHARLQDTLDTLEESYFSSEWILAKMLQTLPEFIFVKDKQHRFVRASDSIAAYHGLPDVIGKTDFDLHPPELARGFWEEEERLLTGEQESFTTEEISYAPDGTTKHFLTTKSIIRDKQGRIAGLMGIGRDVTHLMDRQTALEYVITQITQQNLQQVEKMKRRQTDEIQESA